MIKTGMKLLVVTVFGMASVAMAESIQVGDPNTVQIQGNTTIEASADSVNTEAAGAGSVAVAKIGGISGGTQIQGNTSITATAKNINTKASGSNSKACSEVGNIGDTACSK